MNIMKIALIELEGRKKEAIRKTEILSKTIEEKKVEHSSIIAKLKNIKDVELYITNLKESSQILMTPRKELQKLWVRISQKLPRSIAGMMNNMNPNQKKLQY